VTIGLADSLQRAKVSAQAARLSRSLTWVAMKELPSAAYFALLACCERRALAVPAFVAEALRASLASGEVPQLQPKARGRPRSRPHLLPLHPLLAASELAQLEASARQCQVSLRRFTTEVVRRHLINQDPPAAMAEERSTPCPNS
jgi:hypothetical protein